MYVSTYESSRDVGQKRGKISNVFDHTDSSEDDESPNRCPQEKVLSRSKSYPIFLMDTSNENTPDDRTEENKNFESSITQVSNSMAAMFVNVDYSDRSSSTESNGTNYRNVSQFRNNLREITAVSETDSEDDGNNVMDSSGLSSLERFLIAFELVDYLKIFQEQQIDLDTLMLLTENDLKSLNLPLGPYRKLFVAIQARRAAFQSPGILSDTKL